MILGLMESAADGTDTSDYKTVKQLIHLASLIPPDAEYFNEVALEIGELKVVSNTYNWNWEIKIESGDAEAIISQLNALLTA